MMSYRDMTFCAGDGCANFGSCPRALTSTVRDAAKRIGLGISEFTDPRSLECHSEHGLTEQTEEAK